VICWGWQDVKEERIYLWNCGEGKEIHASFAVASQIEKVKTTAQDRCLVKLKMALNHKVCFQEVSEDLGAYPSQMRGCYNRT
jgi:hypothetical protein